MKNKLLVLAMIFSLLIISNTANAAHYLSGSDSVDSGEIRWGGYTQYSSAWSSGIARWNLENPIDILPDTWWTYQDLTVSDINMSSWDWYGAYGTDHIWFNVAHMQYLTLNQKKHVATHELGHALGLDHSYSGNVMYSGSFQTYLGTQDKYDYHYLWGY